MIIEDGQGKGKTTGVTYENRLKVEAVTQTLEHHTNQEHGLAFQYPWQQTPTGAGDCFLYVKNLDDVDLVVEGFYLRAAGAEQVEVKLGDSGTPAGGTDRTLVNCNAGSGKTADVTFQTGNDITGLSGGSVVERLYVPNGTESKYYNLEQDVIVPKNNVLTLYAVNGSIEVDGTFICHFHDPSD